MTSKKIMIHIKEIDEKKLIGLDIKDFTKEEVIVVLNICLNKILNDCEIQSGVVIVDQTH
jgi:hypothetical protein